MGAETKDRDELTDRAAADRDAELLHIARNLAHELNPQRHDLEQLTLGAGIDRDWGFDSLSRAELLFRVERRFSVHLPESLLGEAETLKDIAAGLGRRDLVPRTTSTPRVPTAVHPSAQPAPQQLATLTAMLDWHAAVQGDRCHLLLHEADGRELPLSYGELAAAARRAASGFVAKGLRPGERVALMLPTGRSFFVAFFGALYAGGVPTPIYPPWRRAQLEEHLRRQTGILQNAGVAMLVTTEPMRPAARLLQWQAQTLRGTETIESIAAAAPHGTTVEIPITPDALALLQYTSGSTGDPKGVTLTHANLLANIRAMGETMVATPADVFVSWLPLYHDMGLIGAWLGSLHYGALLVVMSPLTFLVRPERWLRAIHQHRGTLSAAPNFAFELCLKKIDEGVLAGLDLSSLRMVANGAEPVSPETIRRFSARFAKCGFRPEAMAPVYGLAENSVGLAFPPPGRAPIIDRIDRAALSRDGRATPARTDDAHPTEFVACGRPLPGHQIRIIGATGELGEREEGRIQFRGPSATSGYFDNPAKTRALFDGLWVETGDLGYIAGGDLFITGRSKDIIIRAGRHLYPQEIEDAVAAAPGIRRGCVAVFGSRDPHTRTERVIVVAESRETDPLRLAELRRAVSDIASRLVEEPPDDVVIVPPGSVPKTSSGKLRRSAARELFDAGTLGRAPRGPWLQVASLALAGAATRGRRIARIAAEILYAGYWWALIGLYALVAWPGVVALPARLRWPLLRQTARLFFRLSGIRIDVESADAWPEPAVVVANHASYIDGLVLAAVLPDAPVFVAKRELAGQLVAGPFLRALGAIFVERRDPEGGVEDARQALALARQGKHLVFFPEGTFTREPGLRAFRMGAFSVAAEAGLRIIPIAIHGTRSILRSDQWFPRLGPVKVHRAETIVPSGTGFDAALRLRERARALILPHCGEPDLAGQASPTTT
jgi:1-acyl-sn-glycerol-3-phosphate acyltransferase